MLSVHVLKRRLRFAVSERRRAIGDEWGPDEIRHLQHSWKRAGCTVARQRSIALLQDAQIA